MKINEKNLCVFARTPPYDMEGFLNKRGERNVAFQRRYFVLKGNLLFYFETKYDKEPAGLVIVEGCTIELSMESDVDKYCFEIAFDGNRTYVLAADTQENMERWMKALTCAGYEYKRIIVAELQRQLQEIEDSRNQMRSNTSQPECDINGRPKPTERRQNPFNRLPPAPPPPVVNAPPGGTVGIQSGVVLTPVNMIPGHFGSSHAKVQQEQQQRFADIGNGNGFSCSPQTTPTMSRRHGIKQQSGSAIFYDDPPKVPPRTKVLAGSSHSQGHNNNMVHMDRLEKQRRLIKSIKMFELMHENYRKEVMVDIIVHRSPLVQL